MPDKSLIAGTLDTNMKRLLIAFFASLLIVVSVIVFTNRSVRKVGDNSIVTEQIIKATVKEADKKDKKDVPLTPATFSLIFIYILKHFS